MSGYHIRKIIAVFIVFSGILLILYPFISNYTYERQQESVIFDYNEKTDDMGEEKVEEEFRRAREYNENLSRSAVVLTDPFDPDALKNDVLYEYENILNVFGNGIMGYIEIPKISVYLPIYHGTQAETLERGVGHLENTSLPIGGESTHCILSGHTGLSDKRLFTDLEMLEIGDIFFVQVLGEHLAYQIDQILVVEPHETDDLVIVQGRDYMTLVTCTPYGVNSHRLLVRGGRIPYEPEQKEQAGEEKVTGQWMRQYMCAIITGVILILILLLAGGMVQRRKRKTS